jgi:hypothetical protein
MLAIYTKISWLILIFVKVHEKEYIFHENLRAFVRFVFPLEREFSLWITKWGQTNNEDLNISTFMRQIQVTWSFAGWGDKYLKLGISPVTPSTRNAMSRLYRVKDKKCDISPFTRGQEKRYLAIYEIRLREAGETYLSTWTRKENSVCVSTAWKLLASNINSRIIEAIVNQETIADWKHQ